MNFHALLINLPVKPLLLLSRFSRLFLILIVLQSCQPEHTQPELFFSQLPASQTGITFNNELIESDTVNFYTNEYMYIGSGVGVGDFNNDGLEDVFFAASQSGCRLYINQGDFRFNDITVQAGIPKTKWCTGVSIIDINQDGFQDIYVCVSHERLPQNRKNLLFINQKNLTFKEDAANYGLADTGFSTQAAFFDYDKDGDLDMYLLNHQLFNPQPNKLIPKDTSGNSPAADKLYRNDSPVLHFTDVSKVAGIKEDGYGLGVMVSDLNGDNYPDIYVANDYLGNDLLWLNNRNGTFTNVIAQSTRHQSYNSMGVDVADINNDLLPDIAVLDMLPPVNERKKMMASGFSPEKYDLQRRLGYEHEYSRNMLQLNQGLLQKENRTIPLFSEIGNLAGIAETDWSWSVLTADFDNDTWKDIHITNGLEKDLTNNDFLFFTKEMQPAEYGFGNGNNSNVDLSTDKIRILREKLDGYGKVKINNFFFHNNRNLTFENQTHFIGLAIPSVSHGAAYADFDNDGDLDLITNNMNQEAFVYRNEIRKTVTDTLHNYLTIRLKGEKGNLLGTGTKLTLYAKGKAQVVEQSPVRGYASSVDSRIHFGVGAVQVIDSLVIKWYNGKTQVLKHIKSNRLLEIDISEGKVLSETPLLTQQPLFMQEFPDSFKEWKHVEMPFFDYYIRRLQPQKYSQLGPCLAAGDVNNDGLEDFFAGGAARQSGRLFIQNKNGGFLGKDLVKEGKTEEDLKAVFFDVDGDKDLDLAVVGGSTEFGRDYKFSPQLFVNDGRGNFSGKPGAFPVGEDSFSTTIAVADIDNDGDIDVFTGGRIDKESFPASPKSYIFRNDKGMFRDVTQEVCPSVARLGMVTDAVWQDLDNDRQPELVVCGEWMPIRFFKNNHGKLTEITARTGLQDMYGMWRSLAIADLDKDGDLDFVAGNLGMNNKYHVSIEKPSHLFAKDLDKNGSNELIPAYFMTDNSQNYQLFPDLDRVQFAEQTPIIKKKYLFHKDFAKASMTRLLDDIDRDNLLDLTCNMTESGWIENVGNGKFIFHIFPREAQFAPVNAIITDDFDHDGNMDVLLAGNEFQTEVSTGRYDASYGLLLKGTRQKGVFQPLPFSQSGIVLEGDVKSLLLVQDKKGNKAIVAGSNNEPLQYFKQK